MGIRAKSSNTGISVKKLLPILSLVRGRRIEEARRILEFMPSPAATNVAVWPVRRLDSIGMTVKQYLRNRTINFNLKSNGRSYKTII